MMEDQSLSLKIAAVVVLYNEDLKSSQTYLSLLQPEEKQLQVLIYDNSGQRKNYTLPQHWQYISDPSNPGVGAAYNTAISWAKSSGCSHLLLLDSDSVFPENALQAYLRQLKETPGLVLLPTVTQGNKILSPFRFSWGKTHYGNGIPHGRIRDSSVVGINSGTMLPISRCNSRSFHEELPLDWSDIYFFRNLGRPIPAVKLELQLQHHLSENSHATLPNRLFRFRCYLKGIHLVPSHAFERGLMFFWAWIRALKWTLAHRSTKFLILYFKEVYGGK